MEFRYRTALPLLSLLILFLPSLQAKATRLILFEVDGLPASFFEAVLDPNSPETANLPNPDLFRAAYSEVRESFSREILLPNLLYYLKNRGCRVLQMHCGTVPLSTPSWAVILTGHPSIIKANAYFNRSTGRVRFYLDAFRETMRTLVAKAGRTAPVWELDLLGIPLLEDYFDSGRTWTSIQILYRQVPADQLSALGKNLLKGGSEASLGVVRGQLDSLAEGYDLPDRHDQAMVEMAAKKLLVQGQDGQEMIDYFGLFFPSMDHQFHVDANYQRTIEYMVKIDDWFGILMDAVQRSSRRDETVIALVSDHGSDFSPIQLNRSFPISQWLRRYEFGGHTIMTPYTERIEAAFTRPVRGIDSPRVYESEDSPYGSRVPFGEDGYYTAYTNHQGNARFDAFLRNSDLNELHLILLKAKQQVSSDLPLEPLFPIYADAHSRVSSWIEGEIESLELVVEMLSSLTGDLDGSSTRLREDSIARLEEEVTQFRELLPPLRRIRSLPRLESKWKAWVRDDFDLSRLIPKGYLGPRNSPKQLCRYVVGWEDSAAENSNGLPDFRTLNYPDLFERFKVTNPNSYGISHPFDFFAIDLPEAEVQIEGKGRLHQVLWLQASNSRGQAILFETEDDRVGYSPIRPVTFELESPSIRPDPGASDPFAFDFASLERTFGPSEWTDVTGEKMYSTLPVVLLDLFRDNYGPFIDSAEFADKYKAYGVENLTNLREALRYRFGQSRPDFRVWLNRGWNANPNLPTPTGSHGGFHPLDARMTFALWGGPDTGVKQGETVGGVYFSWDIASTLLELVGLREQARPPLPGRVIPVFKTED